MTNPRLIDVPTGRPPLEPRPAYVVTNRSMVDQLIWLVLLVLVAFVLGLLVGKAHQQSVYDEAAAAAREAHSLPLGTNAVLIVSQAPPKELEPLKENPNCALYNHHSCPFDPPTPPKGAASTSQA